MFIVYFTYRVEHINSIFSFRYTYYLFIQFCTHFKVIQTAVLSIIIYCIFWNVTRDTLKKKWKVTLYNERYTLYNDNCKCTTYKIVLFHIEFRCLSNMFVLHLRTVRWNKSFRMFIGFKSTHERRFSLVDNTRYSPHKVGRRKHLGIV